MRPAALAAALAALAGLAAADGGPDRDLADPQGDVAVRAAGGTEPVPGRPGLDIVAFASRGGARIAQTVTLAAPVEEGATVTVHNEVAPGTALVVSYHHAPLEAEAPTTGSVRRAGQAPEGFPVEAGVEGANVTLRFDAARVPAGATCFEPAVIVGLFEDGRLLEDTLEHPEHRCAPAATPAAGALLALLPATLLARRRHR